jgi:hypothetical protein
MFKISSMRLAVTALDAVEEQRSLRLRTTLLAPLTRALAGRRDSALTDDLAVRQRHLDLWERGQHRGAALVGRLVRLPGQVDHGTAQRASQVLDQAPPVEMPVAALQLGQDRPGRA